MPDPATVTGKIVDIFMRLLPFPLEGCSSKAPRNGTGCQKHLIRLRLEAWIHASEETPNSKH
jgi:hypothetical protein